MTLKTVLNALSLPPQAMVGHRVPKTLLIENGAPTAADKRHIEGGIEEFRWVATLKPMTVGIAPHKDDTRDVLELAVLTLRLRPQARVQRLVELVHRAIPYHSMLIAEPAPACIHFSLADKRWAQNERDKVVLDGDLIQCELHALAEPVRDRFLEALALANQPRANLYALYRGWIDTILTAQAAEITGEFTPAENGVRAAGRAKALKACAALEQQMARLRAAAAREKQAARQVELNLELRRLRGEYEENRQQL